jgi:Trypsin-like peptidase domain
VVERAIAASIAPLVWFEPDAKGSLKARNGTAFFVSAERTFVVTADHVFMGYLAAQQDFGKGVRAQLGNLAFRPEDRLIARDARLDIATFVIEPDEIQRTFEGKFAMSFDPMVPQTGRGVVFVGFPGRERHHLSEWEIETGIFSALTVAENVTNLQISGHFDRRYQVDKPGRPTAPTGYDIGGVSGAPLVTIVDSPGLHYWRLGGVMTEYSTTSELFYATRADFILPDGTLRDPT